MANSCRSHCHQVANIELIVHVPWRRTRGRRTWGCRKVSAQPSPLTVRPNLRFRTSYAYEISIAASWVLHTKNGPNIKSKVTNPGSINSVLGQCCWPKPTPKGNTPQQKSPGTAKSLVMTRAALDRLKSRPGSSRHGQGRSARGESDGRGRRALRLTRPSLRLFAVFRKVALTCVWKLSDASSAR